MSLTRKQKRLSIIGGALAFLGLAVGLVLFALRQDIVFFRTPSDLQTLSVEKGSVIRGKGTKVTFEVTDTAHAVKVTYNGILPDLFREGQGVVTEGAFAPDGTFVADTVLAKHDEKYMPKEVADALKKKGLWEGKGG
jgi:cytochrome c-type biogenesis protein CcmE